MLPKAELHVHHEFTAPPKLIKKLAERNNIIVPDELFASEDTFAWHDFASFLQLHDKVCAAIRFPQDYYDITYEYLKHSAAQGVIYTELLYSPEHAESVSGMSSEEHLQAIGEAILHAKNEFNITGTILMAFIRHYGVESTINVANHTVAMYKKFPFIVGANLAGDEINFPPELFTQAFEIIHNEGLGCTAHAGEFCGPESIWKAIELLPITRIGHGVRCVEDPQLLETIIHRGLTLEVCPTSNIALKVYNDYSEHPLPTLINSGAKVTLNSDDPPYFNTTIGHEYEIAQNLFGLSDSQLLQCTRNAIDGAFVDESIKKELLKQCNDLTVKMS